jgi:hypothetical protein
MQSGWRVPTLFSASGKVRVAHQSDPAPIVDAIIASATQAVGLDRQRVMREQLRSPRRCRGQWMPELSGT